MSGPCLQERGSCGDGDRSGIAAGGVLSRKGVSVNMDGDLNEKDGGVNIEYDTDAIDSGNFPLYGCIASIAVIMVYALIKSFLS